MLAGWESHRKLPETNENEGEANHFANIKV